MVAWVWVGPAASGPQVQGSRGRLRVENRSPTQWHEPPSEFSLMAVTGQPALLGLALDAPDSAAVCA